MSGDSGRREVSTFHRASKIRRKGDLVLLDLQLSLEVVAGVLSKFTLLPADFPNWRMAEVSVCEKLGSHAGLG